MTHMMNNKCWMFASSWKPCISKTDLSKHNLIKRSCHAEATSNSWSNTLTANKVKSKSVYRPGGVKFAARLKKMSP